TDLLLGEIYEYLGDAERQCMAYRRVLVNDPGSVPGCLGLASGLTARGKYADAVEIYRRIAAGKPEIRVVMARLMILHNLRQPEDQREWASVEHLLDKIEEDN